MTTVVIGESLVDLVWRTGADSLTPIPGGSPANVAIGLRGWNSDNSQRGRPAPDRTCLERMLRRCVTAGALASRHPGAHSPTRDEIHKLLAAHNEPRSQQTSDVPVTHTGTSDRSNHRARTGGLI